MAPFFWTIRGDKDLRSFSFDACGVSFEQLNYQVGVVFADTFRVQRW